MFKEYSPDKAYILEVYTKKNFFSMPGGGGASNKIALVVLKNKWGWTIGKSNDECSVTYDQIKIEWDYPSNQVWFGTARSIHLETGACNY